mgnify:CR=1 FL=1
MHEITVSISEDGSLIFLKNEATKDFIRLGDSTTRRASHVEPDNSLLRIVFHVLRKLFGDKGWMSRFTRLWPCLWRINLSPTGGPVLEGRWRDRQEAISKEIEWVNENFL